ncbi:MAG: LarC family nickel insertion protein, partial [Clostridiales bacterium]|nr:LarC family nickel insertion protein [Clostridiales bacterium]
MKTLFLECGMGAAGDMLMGALLELYADRDGFINRMNNIGLPGTRIAAEKTVKCGITGTHIAVTINGEMENIGEPHH